MNKHLKKGPGYSWIMYRRNVSLIENLLMEAKFYTTIKAIKLALFTPASPASKE